MKKSLPPQIILTAFIICLTGNIVFGQNTEAPVKQLQNVENKIAEMQSFSDPAIKLQVNELEQLVFGSNPTLFIYDGDFSLFGGKTPVVLDVHTNSLDFVYSNRPEFENIELIRIKVFETEDLNLVLNTSNLGHFKNLKYVYFLVTFEICPENPGDTVCQEEIINNMISGSSQKSSMPVLFQVSLRM